MPKNLPSYEQQQAIKQDTTNILSQFPIRSGTDWSLYNRLMGDSSISVGAGQTIEVLNVQGTGYLQRAIGTISGVPSYMEVILDGITVYKGKIQRSTTFEASGFLTDGDIIGYSTDTLVTYFKSNGGVFSIPEGGIVDDIVTDQSVQGLALIPLPLFFENSAIIKITNTHTSAGTASFSYRGGVI